MKPTWATPDGKVPAAQPGLPGIPLYCGLNDCPNVAVCGLQSRTYPELRFNVCAPCFKETTGKEWPRA